jgi:hypothetical protein
MILLTIAPVGRSGCVRPPARKIEIRVFAQRGNDHSVPREKFLFRFSEKCDYLSQSRSHRGALRDRHERGKRDAMDVLAARTIIRADERR